MRKALIPLLFLASVLFFSSCKFYKQDIMFRLKTRQDSVFVKQAVATLDKNYPIQANDWIFLQVFANKGEMIVDPNSELARQLGGGAGGQNGGIMPMMGMMGGGAMGGGGGAMGSTGNGGGAIGRYLVQSDGSALLPLVGRVKLEGLTYRKADSLLSKLYSEFYEEAFVITRATNRRVFVFGAGGGQGGVQGNQGSTAGITPARGSVVLLENERSNIIEVLAQAGGLGLYSKAQNIRIIRGGLDKPTVHIINLQYVHTLTENDLTIYPGDIIYIEPGRRMFFEAARDLATIVSLPLGLISLTLVLLSNR